MTTMQIVSVIAAGCVGLWYLLPVLPARKNEPEMLAHLRNIIAVRDTYKNADVTAKCNALMEALLGIKP